ncbi:DUF2007 domain-containing protein [Chloroflexota bacterium]
MAKQKSGFVEITSVQGEIAASVLKSHLESEGIPVVLKYESAGRVYGITVNGLGAVRILVPAEHAEKACHIIEPKDPKDPEDSGTDGEGTS